MELQLELTKEKQVEVEVETEMEMEMEIRVLVVDDSPIDRKIVEGLLKRNGNGCIKVIAVDSGTKAMELLQLNKQKAEPLSPASNEIKFDIILTDYCMPEMTGYDLLKAVKNFSRTIPVVIMSSENEPQRISRCKADGAEDFILKPLQTNDVQKLRNYANKSTKPSELKSGIKRKMISQLDLASAMNIAERKRHLSRVVMVLKSSSLDISPYFPLACKLVLLFYAMLCLSQLLHR
ncbi:two-component response regulator-like protein [Rhynchospora pubera]|uniref:Two-component response regulator-like protein n=1 Tax=Rhynchospora pubera TaxID=906938 RepID=A0AAV8H983_9POAL|nr:two-component response regulator-like protein [Rhynchospora pubera]KAJ4814249.1 two-component response regulator-like protein [Rhynchospora pubera]